jgi:hypothetical protein
MLGYFSELPEVSCPPLGWYYDSFHERHCVCPMKTLGANELASCPCLSLILISDSFLQQFQLGLLEVHRLYRCLYLEVWNLKQFTNWISPSTKCSEKQIFQNLAHKYAHLSYAFCSLLHLHACLFWQCTQVIRYGLVRESSQSLPRDPISIYSIN